MLKLTKLQCFKILIVYCLLALLAFACYNVKKILKPVTRRAFQCSDKSLAKPFVYDTVSPQQLHLLGIYFPIVLIITCELMSCWSRPKSMKKLSRLLEGVLRTVIVVTLFLCGLSVERLYKTVAKIKMGRLRPNFITVCQPATPDGAKCSGLMQPDIMNDYECSSIGYPSWAVRSAFSSFPSGHTSLTAYGMIFIICYLYLMTFRLKRLKMCSTLVILIMQVLCFSLILFVAISRVLDFRHHWSDVCAGFIGGSCLALAVNYYLQSQLKTIEKWLAQVSGGAAEDVETMENGGFVIKNINQKETNCGMEGL